VDNVGLATAFLAGLASFLSPCVLPLIPGYLSFMSGVSVQEMAEGKTGSIPRVTAAGLLFVLGFSLVFIALGAAATAVGGVLRSHLRLLHVLAGLLIIVFGIHLTGLLRLGWLQRERRYQGKIAAGPGGAFLVGMAFAFGWTPCVGPILFSILAYAGTQETLGKGIALLVAYSLGLGIPFLLIGLGMGTFLRFLRRWGSYLRWLEVGGGVLLVVLGLLMVTGYLSRLTGFLAAPRG
jgi:cytochrome c-type biogenesis protein